MEARDTACLINTKDITSGIAPLYFESKRMVVTFPPCREMKKSALTLHMK